MADATIAPSARPTRIVAFAPRRTKEISPAASFHGRVRPQRCHSAMTAATSASVIGEIESADISDVIAGHAEGGSPESITTDRAYGFRARRGAAPRNDQWLDHSTFPGF